VAPLWLRGIRGKKSTPSIGWEVMYISYGIFRYLRNNVMSLRIYSCTRTISKHGNNDWLLVKFPINNTLVPVIKSQELDVKIFAALHDPGGYRCPPTFSNWLKTIFFGNLLFLAVFNFWGRFEALNDVFWENRFSI
jgi:hypothetical protein